MEFEYTPYVNQAQVEFCGRLGLSVAGDTISLAKAKLDDFIDTHFYGNLDLGKVTAKQAELAAKFGFKISKLTKREGEAIITDIMTELNFQSIKEQNLAPGVNVINKWDALKRIEIISSIRDDGSVFLKGGNGKRAWARSLIKVDEN